MLFYLNLLIPLIMILIGLIFTVSPPTTMNRLYGYRTRRSMKNKNTWLYAHKYCGRLFLIIGGILFVVALSIALLMKTENIMLFLWELVIQLLFLTLTSFFTEMALKKKFDHEGNERL